MSPLKGLGFFLTPYPGFCVSAPMAPCTHPGLAHATMWRAVTTDVVYRYGEDIVSPCNDPYRAIAGWHIYTDAITRYNLSYPYATGIIGVFIPGDTFTTTKAP